VVEAELLASPFSMQLGVERGGGVSGAVAAAVTTTAAAAAAASRNIEERRKLLLKLARPNCQRLNSNLLLRS
jgi:hypothetical protein